MDGRRRALGYDVEDRKLVINEREAETVRTLFRLYLDLGTVTLVKQEADRLGLKTKARKPNNGNRPGGAPFTRGHLYKLLANPVYVGDITHKGARHKGEHQPIIGPGIWEQTQDQLKAHAVGRHHSQNAETRSLPTGKLIDHRGDSMVPSYTKNAGRRYR